MFSASAFTSVTVWYAQSSDACSGSIVTGTVRTFMPALSSIFRSSPPSPVFPSASSTLISPDTTA